MELHKAHCEQVDLDKPYRFNNRFLIQSHPMEAWNSETQDVDLGEDAPRLHSKEYRSRFGPCFSSNTHMYECNNTGLRGAVRRLTCVRKPEIPGLHEELKNNQDNCETYLGPALVEWVAEMTRRITHASSYLDDNVAERRRWTWAKHAKKYLRIKVELDVHHDGRENHPTRMKAVEYKCKPGELLAEGKYLRGVGDLTTPGSSVLGYYMDTVKECFSQKYYSGESFAQFIKVPDRDVLSDVFRQIIYPEELSFFYFSDDACFGLKCSDGNFMCNMDISACDGSNYDVVFRTLWKTMRGDSRFVNDVDGAFYQCAAPCVIRSTRDTPYRRVTMIPKFFTLYSGSVLTTSINNMANTLIFLSIKRQLNGRLITKAEVPALVERAARLVGYIVKIDACVKPQQLQFLKHSPAMIDDRIIPWLNIGVLCRGFGTYRGDLPGKSKLSWRERAKIFNSDVVKSYVHAGEHAITRAFRKHIVDDSYGVQFEQTELKSIGGSNEPIPLEQLCLRYGLSAAELEELVFYIENSEVGHVVGGKALDVIFAKDYGY